MNRHDMIYKEWRSAMEERLKKGGFKKLCTGNFTISDYKEILKQIYLHARENPQIQALAAVYFRGSQRKLVKDFYQHATSEIGHNDLAMNDLIVLGENVESLPYQRPLPATSALLGYIFYQIQHHNPIGYLGYLFHLEYLPTQYGKLFTSALENKGVPKEAMSFLIEHVTVDKVHNKWIESYIDKLVLTKDDLESVIATSKTTAYLYEKMIEAAMDQANVHKDWGIQQSEYVAKNNFVRDSNSQTLFLNRYLFSFSKCCTKYLHALSWGLSLRTF